MNWGPPLSSWLQMPGVLALEVALVVACAAAAARWIKSSHSSQSSIWQRTIWQVCWLVLAILTAAEITGLGRAAVAIARSRFHPSGTPVTTASQFTATAAAGIPVRQTAKLAPVGLERTYWEDSASMTPAPRTLSKIQSPPPEPASHGLPVLIWLLLSGVLLIRWLILRVSFAWFGWRYLRRAPPALRDEVIDLARRIGLKRIIRVLQSARLSSPIAFGVFRPAVGLPGNFVSQHPPARRQVMLAHELAHLQSHDPEWYLLADIVLALLWWHPMAWWAQCRLHDASEAAADEASLIVNDGPIVLAECLVELGGQLIYKPSPVGLGVAGYGLRSNLAQRVRSLLKINGGSWRPPAQWRIMALKSIGTVALLAAILTGAAWVQPGQPNHQGSTSSAFTIAWQKSPLASLLNSAIGTENPLILFAKSTADGRSATSLSSGKTSPGPTKAIGTEKIQLQPGANTGSAVTSGTLNLRAGFQTRSWVITNGYDQSFIDYFGTAGVTEVERAIKMLNAGPDSGKSTAEKPTADRENIFQPTPGGGDKGAIPGGPSASARPALQTKDQSNTPASSVGTNSTAKGATKISKGRQYIFDRLDQIIIPEVFFNRLPLSEVIWKLDEDTRASDIPDGNGRKKGLNFIINSHLIDLVPTTSAIAGPSVIDPATGLAITGKPEEGAIDLDKVLINISPPLKDLKLAQVLDAIVRSAGKPIKFTVEDYAVVFTQRTFQPPEPGANNPPQPSPTKPDQNTPPPKLRSGVAPETPSEATPKAKAPGPPGIDPQKIIQEEALRREEIAAVLKINFSRAVESHKKGDLASAVKFYDEVLSLAREIGDVGVEAQKKEALAGLGSAHLELAYRAQERGDFGAARAEADAILKYDPDNVRAIKFKEFNQQVAEANRSRLPSPEARARILAYRERQSRIDQMVRDAQGLFDAKAYDEAKSKFTEAIELDPSNDTAFYYLRLIQEKDAEQASRQRALVYGQRVNEIAKLWTKETPSGAPSSTPATNVPAAPSSTNPPTDAGRQSRERATNQPAGIGESDPRTLVLSPGITNTFVRVPDNSPAIPSAIKPAGQAPDLQTTVIRVDLPAFYRELENAGGMDSGSLDSTPFDQLGSKVQSLWRNYFEKVGAQYGFRGMAPQLLLQTLAGIALVRGTPDETELAERFAVERFRTSATAAARPHSKPVVNNDGNLLTRIFRLDAETVGKSLENIFYFGRIVRKLPERNDPDRPAAMNEMLREFLAAAGADLNPGSPFATRILFNSLNGTLMVRATARDFDIIQSAVELLNVALQQVRIESREYDLSAEQLKNLKLEISFGHGAETGLLPEAPADMTAFLTAEKFSAALHALEQSGIQAAEVATVIASSRTPARIACPDGTFIDLTPTATADNSGIETLARFAGRTKLVMVQNGCTVMIGLQSAPKSKLHFLTMTLVDSKGNTISGTPPASGK